MTILSDIVNRLLSRDDHEQLRAFILHHLTQVDRVTAPDLCIVLRGLGFQAKEMAVRSELDGLVEDGVIVTRGFKVEVVGSRRTEETFYGFKREEPE